MADKIVGVTIHNVPHEAEMDAIEGMKAQVNAFVKEYRG